MLSSIVRDLAYAARALRKSPGFAAAAVALLAAGIGGTATVFSLADALLFRPLALPSPAEMVRVVSVLPGRPSVSYYPYAYFEEWRARTFSLSGAFAEADVDTNLTEDGGSRLVRTGIVSADYFTTLRATPAAGRLLGAADEWAAQGELPAVLSHDFWRTRFHGQCGRPGLCPATQRAALCRGGRPTAPRKRDRSGKRSVGLASPSSPESIWGSEPIPSSAVSGESVDACVAA